MRDTSNEKSLRQLITQNTNLNSEVEKNSNEEIEENRETSVENYQTNSLSIYEEDTVSEDTLKHACMKLSQAFPSLKSDWFVIFKQRVKENKFSEQRLKDAVNHCIDNFTHGRAPHIANIVNFDRYIKLYSYSEMADIVYEHDTMTCKDFVKIYKNGKYWWALKSEYYRYFSE